MTFGEGHVLIRIVGSQVHITELSHTEVAPKRRVMQLERFIDELRPEPLIEDRGADYKPGAATNRSFDR